MHWLRPLFRRSAVEREMDAELRFHFEQLVEDLMAKGATRGQAIRQARIRFGGMGQVKNEACWPAAQSKAVCFTTAPRK